ncbi:uncharacterized protein BDR25DRAFT_348190 [Lindgomyces ingoldianus]|uniref:Uncharacterized protein n=1 Tax=Lindgomyces ingoldianus TaxID=673940 RepID=A0ACB6RF28_9PLEO|nr:uncharacterized protein BDR25DRAFT_348190 [Lindgomyces ingoldianus]KAF2477879.1 hypothetical protein BDR25DRAFT_348190 [Lindgomyces ingoldianus]
MCPEFRTQHQRRLSTTLNALITANDSTLCFPQHCAVSPCQSLIGCAFCSRFQKVILPASLRDPSCLKAQVASSSSLDIFVPPAGELRGRHIYYVVPSTSSGHPDCSHLEFGVLRQCSWTAGGKIKDILRRNTLSSTQGPTNSWKELPLVDPSVPELSTKFYPTSRHIHTTQTQPITPLWLNAIFLRLNAQSLRNETPLHPPLQLAMCCYRWEICKAHLNTRLGVKSTKIANPRERLQENRRISLPSTRTLFDTDENGASTKYRRLGSQPPDRQHSEVAFSTSGTPSIVLIRSFVRQSTSKHHLWAEPKLAVSISASQVTPKIIREATNVQQRRREETSPSYTHTGSLFNTDVTAAEALRQALEIQDHILSQHNLTRPKLDMNPLNPPKDARSRPNQLPFTPTNQPE